MLQEVLTYRSVVFAEGEHGGGSRCGLGVVGCGWVVGVPGYGSGLDDVGVGDEQAGWSRRHKRSCLDSGGEKGGGD